MYNNILEEGKQLARLCSQEQELYRKVLPLMKWIRTNVQNGEVEEMKAASADYLGVQLNEQCQILPSALKRTTGAMSTKRKRSGVESASTSSKRSKPCTLCLNFGHYRSGCPLSGALGTRLTKAVYSDKMQLVATLQDSIEVCDICFVIPKGIVGVQILGCVVLGASTVFKCNIVERGCELRVGECYWIEKGKLDEWSSSGNSQAHNIWIK